VSGGTGGRWLAARRVSRSLWAAAGASQRRRLRRHAVDTIVYGREGAGDHIAKQRDVPVLPAVAKAVRAYLAACPLRLELEGPLFVGRHYSPLAARSAQR
jgi:integrase